MWRVLIDQASNDDATNSFKSTTRVYNKIIQSVSFYFALLLILLPLLASAGWLTEMESPATARDTDSDSRGLGTRREDEERVGRNPHPSIHPSILGAITKQIAKT